MLHWPCYVPHVLVFWLISSPTRPSMFPTVSHSSMWPNTDDIKLILGINEDYDASTGSVIGLECGKMHVKLGYPCLVDRGLKVQSCVLLNFSDLSYGIYRNSDLPEMYDSSTWAKRTITTNIIIPFTTDIRKPLSTPHGGGLDVAGQLEKITDANGSICSKDQNV